MSFFAAILPLIEPDVNGKVEAEIMSIMTDFIDRVLGVIENAVDLSSVIIVDSFFFSLLRLRFPAVFVSVRTAIFIHVTSTFFDSEAAQIPCHLAAFLVTNICVADPEESLPIFMKKISKQVLDLTSDPTIIMQETPDDELYWNMNILTPLMSVGLPALEPFVEDIIKIIKRAVGLKCKKLRELGCELLAELLHRLTSTYVCPIQSDKP